jgi:hypothetical protein
LAEPPSGGASAKNRDLVLAVIAGCIAWFIVEVLRSVLGYTFIWPRMPPAIEAH